MSSGRVHFRGWQVAARRVCRLAVVILGSVHLLPVLVHAQDVTRPPASSALSPPSFTSPQIEQRITALLKQMTLEEKLGQLTQQWGGEHQDVNPVVRENKLKELLAVVRSGQVGSFLGAHGAEYTNRLQRAAVEESHLGIPLIFGNDVIHGYRTIFPIPLAEASTWDPALVEQSARIAATEARAAGTHWTFAPMVDIARDPRWGRIAEGAGEDPYLGAIMAAARVRGFQSDDLTRQDALLACAKHYVAYGGAEGGRDYNTVDISEYTLREIYLPPFKAAVDAGVGTLMSAFNEINGIPATANQLTLKTILRQEWGFNGFVVSDWNSIQEMVVHGFAENPATAAELAIAAGVDMDMSSFTYRSHLADSVRQNRLSEHTVDEAVRRVLRMKFAVGLFDTPYADVQRERAVTLTPQHRAAAREVARHSIVLLKNDNDLLPLSSDLKSIAVVGPLATSRKDPLGTWAAVGKPEDVVTVLEGIQQRVKDSARVQYAKGCDPRGTSTAEFAEALRIVKESAVAIVVAGETEDMTGEGYSRSSIDLPPIQQQLIRQIHETGVPVVLVLLNGRPLSIVWSSEHVPAIVNAWHGGVECGNAVADVLFGDFNPTGRLPVTVPRSAGQIPIYYNHKNTGRPPADHRYTSKYIDLPSTPLFPFGYGLSYTRFKYDNVKLSVSEMKADGALEVSVDVHNAGPRAGQEVVQLYIRDLVGSTTRPVKELKGLAEVELQPAQTRTVTFTIYAAHLKHYNPRMQNVVEPGEFQLWVGPNAAEGLTARFTVISE